MCGILLVYGDDPEPALREWIKKLVHRGPDNIGFYINNNIAMAFARLSINDQSPLGNQPHQTDEFVTMMNAEIYNHQELKEKYQIRINGNSDSHVIAPLFSKLGNRILKHLDGFYSGVLYNKKTKQLFTIRDYIGKKGLFLVKSGEFSVITSELKAVPEIDHFQIIPKGLSEINVSDWTINHTIKHKRLEYAEKKLCLPTILEKAVKKRIPYNSAPFGVFLSGGLDSSILSAILKGVSSNARFYILAEKRESSDYIPAQLVLQHLKIDTARVIRLPNKDKIQQLIEQLVWITESYNPSIISNGICSYLLSLAANEDGLKVVISGEGADEMFGGYHYCKETDNWKNLRQKLLDDMHFTELRRIDHTCMSNSIESRFPYLDRNIYNYSNSLKYEDLYKRIHDEIVNKYILRTSFEHMLPKEIIWRKKTSSDVGSGIRKMVVEYLTNKYGDEKKGLLKIWKSKFNFDPNDQFFHSYPSFDKAIQNRGITHK